MKFQFSNHPTQTYYRHSKALECSFKFPQESANWTISKSHTSSGGALTYCTFYHTRSHGVKIEEMDNCKELSQTRQGDPTLLFLVTELILSSVHILYVPGPQ